MESPFTLDNSFSRLWRACGFRGKIDQLQTSPYDINTHVFSNNHNKRLNVISSTEFHVLVMKTF